MGNAFEVGERKLIPATLIYAMRKMNELPQEPNIPKISEVFDSGQQVLMLNREARPGHVHDFHRGKWNGLGGKLERDESAVTAARREFLEEAGLDLEEARFQPLGTLLFPLFKPHRSEDWLVFVFVVDLKDHEIPQQQCSEGSLSFIEDHRILGLPLWPGDLHFLPFVFKRKPFWGTFWYLNGELSRYELR